MHDLGVFRLENVLTAAVMILQRIYNGSLLFVKYAPFHDHFSNNDTLFSPKIDFSIC